MIVLDAYAVLAFLRAEPAADEVAAVLRRQCAISTVNLAETVDQLVRVYGWPADDVSGDIALLVHDGLDILPINANNAFAAGELRARYYHRQHSPLSLADCFAAATALAHGAELATSDPPLAALVRTEGGKILALPDSTGSRP